MLFRAQTKKYSAVSWENPFIRSKYIPFTKDYVNNTWTAIQNSVPVIFKRHQSWSESQRLCQYFKCCLYLKAIHTCNKQCTCQFFHHILHFINPKRSGRSQKPLLGPVLMRNFNFTIIHLDGWATMDFFRSFCHSCFLHLLGISVILPLETSFFQCFIIIICIYAKASS